MEQYERKRSWVWFLLPVFVQVVGGIIAYYALKPDEPRMAKDCLYIGIVLSGINWGAFVLLLSMGLLIGEHSMMSEFERSYQWDFDI
ncbi:MAG: hypothetical protein OEL69_07295 [Nitrosopumilus sp.]|nr:hypothetical protein [Nitrosopumilus sp.]